MKKQITLILLTFITFTVNSQVKDSIKESKDFIVNDFNKLTIEFSTGNSKGLKPYTSGYYSSNNHPIPTSVNSFNLAARYMFSPIFGIKGDLGYLDLKNGNSDSLPFETQIYTLGVQGVVNASRLFSIDKSIGRFGLLIHGGFQFSQSLSKTQDEVSSLDPSILVRTHNYGKRDNNIGFVIGLSPQFRLTDRIGLISDFAIVSNYRQHFAWDGASSNSSNNLGGELVSMALGLTYSIGNENTHGDWTEVRYNKDERISALQNRLNTIEGIMDDTANRIINDSYISIDFEEGKMFPPISSNKNIDFMKTYLIQNPSVTINIIGHADKEGFSDKNSSISKVRAEAVRSILLKSGIKGNRLIIKAPEVNSTLEDNNKALGKVIFKVN